MISNFIPEKLIISVFEDLMKKKFKNYYDLEYELFEKFNDLLQVGEEQMMQDCGKFLQIF